jgi:adenylate kinase family enzyme
MYRIHIFGASGSGVSTLGIQLSQRLKIPVFDCDTYYWEKTDPPYVKVTPIPIRQRSLLNDLEPLPSWICSGSMDSWSEPFEGLFTQIVFLYVPKEIRIERLRERERKLWGDRIAEGGDMYNEHEKFISWASQYDEGVRSGRSLPRHKQWLARQTAPTFKIEGILSPEETLRQTLVGLQEKIHAKS